MTQNMFQTIYSLLCPNNATNKYCLNPILIKNINKGDASWSTTKTVIGWAIGTDKQVLTPPPLVRKENLDKALGAIPKYAQCCSKKKWQCFLGLFQSAVPVIAGSHRMFSWLQHALQAGE